MLISESQNLIYQMTVFNARLKLLHGRTPQVVSVQSADISSVSTITLVAPVRADILTVTLLFSRMAFGDIIYSQHRRTKNKPNLINLISPNE